MLWMRSGVVERGMGVGAVLLSEVRLHYVMLATGVGHPRPGLCLENVSSAWRSCGSRQDYSIRSGLF